ncbi:MAG: Gfo/Idh/MocA family oxidoreductase, partial [Phycisphaerales bacterium]|nr:Gfo/Idh/MocA family oxidoreductase [Phycisphaerales bacterium]
MTAGQVIGRRSANDEVRAAVIGVRGRGSNLMRDLHGVEGVRVVALCDPDRQVLAERAKWFDEQGKPVEQVADLRRLLERKDIDVIATATPNHWHALVTIWALQTGRHVYCEKPVSHNVFEGRQMVNASRHYDRVVQTGTQSRSSQAMREAIGWLQAGGLGAMKFATATCYKPRQSIGRLDAPLKIPDHIDFDLWTGPAAMQDIMRPNLHYDWHWDFNTGNGDLGNQGIHQMDIARWATGANTLSSRILSVGGRFGYEDAADTPNSMVTWHEYPVPIIFEVRGLPRDASSRSNWGKSMDTHHGMSVGAAVVCEQGHIRFPNYQSAVAFDNDGNEVKRWQGASNHMANFIDAARRNDRNVLNADILEGHLSSALCHTGNISYRLGSHHRPEEVRDRLRSNPVASDSFERLAAHLDA